MLPEAIFFDAGGTLVLQHPGLMTERLGFPIAAEASFVAHYRAMAEFSALKSAGTEATWEWWLDRYFGLLDHPDPAGAGPALDFGRGLWSWPLHGTAEAIEAIRTKGIRVGVISNSDGSVAQSLAEAGLAGLFEDVIDSAVEGVAKPDPGIFLLACRRLGVDPARCWYVGDSEYHDVAGSRAAGFAASWLVDPLDLGNHDRKVSSVADLPGEL